MLTRPHALRIVAVACIGALFCLPVVAGAQTTKDRVAATRAAVDAAASRWFDAQDKAATLSARISRLEQEIASADARVATARKIASARALVMYEGASEQYASILDGSAMEMARRAQLVGVANAKNADAIDELTSSLDDLHAQKRELEGEQARQRKALDEVASERQALDARLSALTTKAQAEARTSALAAARLQAVRATRATAETRDASATSTASPTRAVASTRVFTVVAPPPSGGGVNSHHNDPFLVCTRARESNGIYTVVSADGYYGAYQFLPSTWDVTANHAGRGDLVGVLPNRASAADQDAMAWTLYQWQGKGPWGGRC